MADQWFRGNTHAHTKICGHADSSPESVAKWYLDHGYNFLILSEHNHFIDPESVKLPKNRRNDFILIPGEEITGKKTVHTTAMNINKLVKWNYNNKKKSAIIQNHVDLTLKANGHAILNHPNYKYAINADDILPVKELYFFELYNGHHTDANNFGNKEHPGTEEMWDKLLSNGMIIYGVSSDDAHFFKSFSNRSSNPGRGWIMVYASKLEPDEIVDAMLLGKFYASSGVYLRTYDSDSGVYQIKVDNIKTEKELDLSPKLRGRHIENGKEGYRIEFIGPNGKIAKEVKGTEGDYVILSPNFYIRAKITFTRKHPIYGLEEYYAWGQPVFNKF